MLNGMKYNQIHGETTKFLKEMYHLGIKSGRTKLKSDHGLPNFIGIEKAKKVIHFANLGHF